MSIVRRKPNSKKLIYTVDGVLVVKTPAECTKWPQAFRMRLVHEYLAPKSLVSASEFRRHFIDNGAQNEIYLVGRPKRRMLVQQPYEPVNRTHLVVLRTEVVDVATKRAMFLYHPDPAMRVLMTYAFMYGKEIPGLPELHIYDHVC